MRILIFITAAVMALGSCGGTDYPYYIKEPDRGDVTGAMWVSISNKNKMCNIDRRTDEIKGYYDVGTDPSRTAVDVFGNCWVGMRGEAAVYNITREGVVTRYENPGFNAPRAVAMDKLGNVWVANSGSGTIQKITRNSNGTYTVSDPVPLGGGYFYGAIVDSKNNLWIADNYQSGQKYMFKYNLSRFPGNTENVDYFRIPVAQLYGFTIDTNGKVWVSSHAASQITKIDAETATIEKEYTTLPEGYCPSGATFDINGNIWFGNYQSGNRVLKFNPFTETMELIPISGAQPHGIGADENGFIYTINFGSGTVSKLNCNTNQEVLTYNVNATYDGDTAASTPYMYSDFTGFIYRNVTLSHEDTAAKKSDRSKHVSAGRKKARMIR